MVQLQEEGMRTEQTRCVLPWKRSIVNTAWICGLWACGPMRRGGSGWVCIHPVEGKWTASGSSDPWGLLHHHLLCHTLMWMNETAHSSVHGGTKGHSVQHLLLSISEDTFTHIKLTHLLEVHCASHDIAITVSRRWTCSFMYLSWVGLNIPVITLPSFTRCNWKGAVQQFANTDERECDLITQQEFGQCRETVWHWKLCSITLRAYSHQACMVHLKQTFSLMWAFWVGVNTNHRTLAQWTETTSSAGTWFN